MPASRIARATVFSHAVGPPRAASSTVIRGLP